MIYTLNEIRIIVEQLNSIYEIDKLKKYLFEYSDDYSEILEDIAMLRVCRMIDLL